MNKQEIRKELDKTKEHLANLEAKLKEMDTKCTKKWKPEYKEVYYYVSEFCLVYKTFCMNTSNDERRYDIGNFFKTESEAKHRAELLETERQLMKFAREHNVEEIDWKNDETRKYYIYYSYSKCQLDIDSSITGKYARIVYFSSKEIAERAIKEIGADKIEAYLKEL